jgi:hypothetical protein
MYESTVCACLFIICPLLNKKTYREREPAEGWVRRKNRVLDRLNLSASVPANMVNPLFMQPADDVADLSSGVVVLPSGSTAPVTVNGTAKAEDVAPWFGWLGTVPVVGRLPYMFFSW